MKYIKKYENDSKLSLYDYVICKEDFIPDSIHEENVKNFTLNNIGQYVKYNKVKEYPYGIKYENIPKSISRSFVGNIRQMKLYEIIYYANTKEELEYIIQANKFNI